MRRLNLESLARFFDFHQLVFGEVASQLVSAKRILDKVDHVLLSVKGSVGNVEVEEWLPNLRVTNRLMVTWPELEAAAKGEWLVLRIREEGGAGDTTDGNVLVRRLVAEDDVERVDNVDNVRAHLAEVSPFALEEIVQRVDVELANKGEADLDLVTFKAALEFGLKKRTK